jgi:hypothetical protein
VLAGSLLTDGNTQEIVQVRQPFHAAAPEFVDLAEGE